MRTLVLYAVIVGIPIGGTSLVLERGRGLRPPPAIWGTWTLGETPARCLFAAGDSGPATLTIGQSGSHLTLALNAGPAIAGRLVWGTSEPLTIESPGSGKAGSHDDVVVELQATVERTHTPWTMEGRITTPSCGVGTPALFRATRRAEAATKAGSH